MKKIFFIMYLLAALFSNPGSVHNSAVSSDKVDSTVHFFQPIIVKGNYLYQFGKLYKINSDGTSKIDVKKGYGNIIDVVNDWVYFVQGNIGEPPCLGIYKTNGKETVKLADEDYLLDAVYYKGAIYYAPEPGAMTNGHIVEGGLYKIDIDGKNKVQLTDQQVSNINIYKDFIYYSGSSEVTDGNVIRNENPGIFKMNIDGTDKKKLFTEEPHF